MLKLFYKFSSSLIALFFIWICFTWNMANVGSETYAPPHGVRWIGFFFRLDQMYAVCISFIHLNRWGMFSPHPPTSQWWYIFEGTLRNGTGVEIFKVAPLFNIFLTIGRTRVFIIGKEHLQLPSINQLHSIKVSEVIDG